MQVFRYIMSLPFRLIAALLMICLDLIGLVIICILWLFAEQDFYDWLETTGEFVIGCMVGATDRFEPAKDAWHQKILKMQHR